MKAAQNDRFFADFLKKRYSDLVDESVERLEEAVTKEDVMLND